MEAPDDDTRFGGTLSSTARASASSPQMARYAEIRNRQPRRRQAPPRSGDGLQRRPCLDPRTQDPVEAVRAFTNGFGADGVILDVVDDSWNPELPSR
jgi:hypothetical protein